MNAKNREKDKPDTSSSGKWLRKLSRSLAGEAQDRGEVIEYLRDAGTREIIEGDALAMLEGVLGVADIQVRDIMVPRAQMTFLNGDDDGDTLLRTVVESGHSRFPVMDEDREKIIGVLLAKDLLRLQLATEEAPFDIKEFMRPAVFVPESKRLNVLLREMRRSRVHMAIVADEYGGYLMAWITMLGAVHLLRSDQHLTMTAFVNRLPPRARNGAGIVAAIIGLGVCIVLLYATGVLVGSTARLSPRA